ncbi:hypothetical protein MBLNU13_g09038t1, partial [Cladosporium sp. NU13]
MVRSSDRASGTNTHIAKRSRRKHWTPLSVYCSPYAMKSCNHEALMELSSPDTPCLVNPYRMDRLVDSLPDPSQQKPLLVACAGNKQKKLALEQLFPANDPRQRDRRPALCKIYTDALTSHLANPIFFMDIDPDRDPPMQDTHLHCHRSQTFSFHKDRSSAHLGAVLTKQLLLPFIDVLCVFAEDVGGCDGVLQHLQSWALANIEGTETQVPTRLVVVLSPSDDAEWSKRESTKFAESFYAFGLGQLFPNMRVETTSSLPLHSARYIPLRGIVLGSVLGAALSARTERMHLFSGLHLASLFSQRLAQTAKHPRRSFCLLLASRQGIPTLSHFVECVIAFLQAAHHHDLAYGAVASLIGTSLLMQAYPPS